MEGSLTLQNLMLALFVVLVLVMVLIAGLLIFSYFKYKTINNRQQWLEIIEDKITRTIVDGYQTTHEDEKLHKLLNNKKFRLLFLESLVASTRRFAGSATEELLKLFHQLDLKQDALNKLNKRKSIHHISDGIQELTAMKTQEVLPEIQSFLNNPNPQIYQEAQYAMVILKGFDGLKFLNTLSHPLSDWQQMRILETIKTVPQEKKSAFVNWLHSSNVTVVEFALRLIRKMQMLEFYKDAEKLLYHPATKVRVQVIKTLQALENENTAILLTTIYKQEELMVQKEILKVLKISKNKKSDDFFKDQLLHHPSSQIKMIAAEALSEIGENQYLHSLKNSTDTPVPLIVKHVLQEKI